MSLEKTLKKVLSVTLVVAFMLQQSGFVFAATPESNWTSLKSDVEATAGEYDVTTALTADENTGSDEGTVFITADGNTITGASLTENSSHDALFNVGSGVTSFNLGNDVSGSIVNDGTMTYTGSSLADGTVTGGGTFVFGGTTTNANAITQTTVETTSSANVTNNAAVTATTFTNNGTFDNNALLTATITNAGTLSSTADNLAGAVENNNALTLEGGAVQAAITGTGDTDISADLSSGYAITQGNVTVKSGATFTNNALVTANITNEANAVLDTDPANLGGAVANEGHVKLTSDGTLAQNITGTNGKTEIRADVVLDDANSISQKDIKVGTGAVFTANANNLSASNEIFNDGQLNIIGGTNANAINGDGAVTFSGTGTITNNGAIDQQTGGVENDADVLSNNALITAEITNNNGKWLLSDASNLNGKVHNEGSLFLQGGTVQDAIDGTGNLFIDTAAVSSAYNISQTWLTATTDFSNSGLASFANLETKSGATVANTNRIDVTNDVINAGAIDNQVGGVFDNSAATGIITNTGAIDNAGTFNAYTINNNAGGNVTNSADMEFNNVTNASGAMFYQDAGTMNTSTTAATFDNSGTFMLDDGKAYLATLTNNAGGNVALNGGELTATTLQNDADIFNDATLNTTNFTNNDTVTGSGTINIDGDSTNNGSITQGLVAISNNSTFTNNGMLLAKANNAAGSTLDSDPDNLGGDVVNAGTLNLNGNGTLSIDVTGTGDTNINGDLNNQGSISQDNINIGAGYVVTSNASDMTATTAINNDGTINYTAGTTANTITGSGRVDITGYVTNTGDITQTTVGNSGVFTNNGTVTANLTNTNTIEGTGSITTGTGISSNTGTIAQADLTNNGTFDNAGHITLTGTLTNNDTFNTNADLLAAAGGVSNAGDLNITGGTNANVITGAGTTNFTGDATNNGAITQTTVTNSANLTNNALITADVTNTGTLTSNGANIAGDIANTGTYVITGGDNANDIIGAGGKTTILGNTTNTGTIMQEALAIANSGDLTTDSDLVTAAITNDGKLIWNAGTANQNVIDGTGELHINGADIANSSTISQDRIKVISGSLTSNADLLTAAQGIDNSADLILTGGTNANAITGSGDLETTGDVINNAAINQNTITVSGGKLTTAADALTTVNGVVNNSEISFTGGDNSNDITGTGIVYIDGNVQNDGDIATDIQVNTGAHYGTSTDVLADLENRGTTDLVDADIQGNITGTGITNILGATVNNGTIDQTALTIAAAGSLTSNSDDVAAAITNDGTYTINAGTGNANAISGNGNLNIIGGAITNNAAISQGNITISGGSLSSDADLLATASGITNNVADGLTLTGGTNTNAITGTGSMVTTGDVVNQALINQDSLTVSGGQFTTDAGLLTTVNGVTNNAAVSLTGGTNTNVITGTGTTFIDGTVENTGTIDTNIGVGTSGHYATSTDITKALANNGITDITNADVNAAISGTGTTNILGATTNNSTIAQGNLNIASSGIFNTDIDNVTAAISNEGAFTITNGTANANVITGNGSLEITGGDIANTASISQGNITITGGALSTDAGLLASASGITNNADLTFTGGTNANAISGTGDLTTTGNVTNNAAISQNTITVSGGKLTTAADALTTNNGIVNNSEISFVSGDNNNDITGTGVTYIDGTVQNLADIYTDMTVNTGAHYGTATDVHAKIDNRGTTDLIDADVLAGGKISGTGTTNILGDTVNNGSITQSAVNIAAGGSLTTNSQDVNAAVTNEGDLIWNAGGANANVISGSGALEITGGNIANSASISQGTITINGGSLTSTADLLATTGGIENNADLALTGGTNTNVITGTGDLATSGAVLNKAAITQNSLTNTGDFTNDKAAIVADIVNSGNFLNDDGTITGDITNTGVFMTMGDDVIGNITNNAAGTYIITDGDNANNITGTGDVQIEGTTINTGKITQDNIFVATGASLVASDISDITTTTGIDNAGTLEMQFGANANAITGNTGALNVTGIVTNNSGVGISQDTINIATLGNFTADAGDLVTVNGITNSGALTLGDGATANNISGTGTLAITGTVTNTGNIDQKSLNNSGTLTSNADLLAFADGITNTNVLNLTGGTNANIISGTGTTNFTNDVVNNAAIEQATVTNDTGTLTNNAAITATFTNNGGTVNNEAVITGAITNNAGTINSTADNLNGLVTNAGGTLNIAGGTTQNTITGSGDMNITADLVNANTILEGTITNNAALTNSGAITATTVFNNSGTVDNTGTITGDITNSGMITSSATNLVGAIANDGTLNLDGGTTQDVITGSGTTNVTMDLTNNYAITQGTVNNDAVLTNKATITAADIINSGTITGKASDLVASNAIDNSGTLVFDAASTGASDITGTGDVQVTANTTLTGTNDYAGGTLIDGATLVAASGANIGTGDVLFANNGILNITAAGSLDNNLAGQAATENVSLQNDAALTLNGTIGTAADFHKLGAGTLTFAMASNTYTGDTYVDGGTLIGNTANINNVVNGAAGTTVEFNDTTDADLNEINTLGTFVQSGSAKLDVKNNAFTANVVNVNAGTFAANRALTANTLNVNTGAKLQGNGTITGDVNVNTGATLAPGNSIDTLTITGNLNLASGSTTAIEITDTPASDKIVVGNNANIAGGANLTVSNVSGRYFEWESFDIMEAANVAGTFTYDGEVTDYDTGRINVSVDYSDPTKVTLTAKRKATDYAGTNAAVLSRNESEVARAVDHISTGFGGDITETLLQLEQLGGLNPTGVTLIDPNATFQSALNELDGVLYANSAMLSLFNAKTAHVYDRIAKRNPSAGACPTCHDNVWVEYYNQYDKVYANPNSPRYTNDMTGVMAGYDRSSDEWLLGVYGGYGESNLRQRNDKMDIEDGTLGIYSGYMHGDWTFKGSLFTGRQNYYGKRHITFMNRMATARYEGWNAGLDLEGSYNLPVFTWMNVKPFAGVFGNYAHQQAFTEKDAGAISLHVESHDQVTVQGRLGIQLDGKVKNRLSWYGSVAVKQIFGNDYAKLHMSFDLPGTRMDIVGAELGRTYLSGQFGLNYALTDSLSLYGNIDTGVNDKSANCYGNIGVAFTW